MTKVVCMKKIWILMSLIILLLAGCGGEDISPTEQGVPQPTDTDEALPSSSPTGAPEATEKTVEDQPTAAPLPEGVVLGVYPSGFLQDTIQELEEFDRWMEPTGKGITIAATFMDFEEGDAETFVPAELESAWERGYIPFVNLSVGNLAEPRTSEHIAEGYLDGDIRSWARAYADWSSQGGRRAFIAPLQEMNGYWVTYGGDEVQFKKAYQRIRMIFEAEGVRPEAVSWVFAPNGWAEEGYEFERYYPGDEAVDVVAFSSFNWGECSNWPKWETYDEIFQPYLERMTAMAPDKPIFIAETGTVSEGGDKDLWIKDTFSSLAAYPNLRGILYFNRWEARSTLENCPDGTDYRVYNPQKDEGYESFLEVMSSDAFVEYAPDSKALTELMFNRP